MIIGIMGIKSSKINYLGSLIRSQRKKLNLSQTQVAQLGNVSLNFVSQLERGKANVQLDKLLDVMKVLGLQFSLGIGSNGIVSKLKSDTNSFENGL